MSKYSGLDDLSVVVAINRRMRFEYRNGRPDMKRRAKAERQRKKK